MVYDLSRCPQNKTFSSGENLLYRVQSLTKILRSVISMCDKAKSKQLNNFSNYHHLIVGLNVFDIRDF